MYKVYARKATVINDCFMSEHDSLHQAQTVGYELLKTIRNLVEADLARPYICIIITDAHNNQLEQYGSM